MDLDSLRNSPIGQLVPIEGVDARLGAFSYWAYIPDPLPDHPKISQATWKAVSDASRALGRLHQACIQLPNPRLLIVPTLVREAMDTSALEGTFGALSEVLEARLPGQHSLISPETREIRAYEDMADQGFEWIKERPLTIPMLCDLQGILARGSRRITRDPGKMREHQVFVGPDNAERISDARYVPPPADDRLRAGLDAWQAWIQTDHDLPVVLRAAMAHYQFEALHPFGDGNGRVGRLAVVLQLLLDGAIEHPAITVSHWFLRRRSEYQDGLLRVSQTGDWDNWVRFFCKAICEQSERSVQAAQALLDWLEEVRRKLSDRHWSGFIQTLAIDLIEWPVITMMFAADKYKVSVPTSKNAIDRLVSIDVLEELTGRPYKRSFGARDVMRIVESM